MKKRSNFIAYAATLLAAAFMSTTSPSRVMAQGVGTNDVDASWRSYDKFFAARPGRPEMKSLFWRLGLENYMRDFVVAGKAEAVIAGFFIPGQEIRPRSYEIFCELLDDAQRKYGGQGLGISSYSPHQIIKAMIDSEGKFPNNKIFNKAVESLLMPMADVHPEDTDLRRLVIAISIYNQNPNLGLENTTPDQRASFYSNLSARISYKRPSSSDKPLPDKSPLP